MKELILEAKSGEDPLPSSSCHRVFLFYNFIKNALPTNQSFPKRRE